MTRVQCEPKVYETLQVRPGSENDWIVLDEQDQPCFSGTWSECEEWLDLRENLAKQQAKNSWLNKFSSLCRTICGLRETRSQSGDSENRLTLEGSIQPNSVSASSK